LKKRSKKLSLLRAPGTAAPKPARRLSPQTQTRHAGESRHPRLAARAKARTKQKFFAFPSFKAKA
jgi:hypothetical protein